MYLRARRPSLDALCELVTTVRLFIVAFSFVRLNIELRDFIQYHQFHHVHMSFQDGFFNSKGHTY